MVYSCSSCAPSALSANAIAGISIGSLLAVFLLFTAYQYRDRARVSPTELLESLSDATNLLSLVLRQMFKVMTVENVTWCVKSAAKGLYLTCTSVQGVLVCLIFGMLGVMMLLFLLAADHKLAPGQ